MHRAALPQGGATRDRSDSSAAALLLLSKHPPRKRSQPEPPPKPLRRYGQVSPWRTAGDGILLTFTLEGSEAPLVRVMATNDNTYLRGSRYQLGTEYWHAAPEIPRGQRLFMHFAHALW